MITRAEYEQKIKKHINSNMSKVLSDKWRSKYHIMAPIGWINDPNGLCQFKDQYHVFYQYSPLEAKGGMKFWGHYVSKDLVHFEERDIAIYPDIEEDKDGVYSGSALAKDDTMYFFYTGNVKHQGNHDYILTGREQNVILVTSKDGIEFSEKKILLRNSDFPEDMSLHVRDPKVWEEDGIYYMVLGARGKNDKGYVLLYKSVDLYNWTLHSVPAGGKENMGYMWECPDLFYLDGKTVFMFSPQGLEADGFKYNNVYQSGYAFGNFVNDKKELKLDQFVELDRGFDFYAPQTFEDAKGRRIMIGWMGVPDAVEHKNPTVENYWQHQLTLPRELKIINNKLYQLPLKELETLRKDLIENKVALDSNDVLNIIDRNTFELRVDLEECSKFNMKFREDCVLSFVEGVFKLTQGKSGYGRNERAAYISNLRSIDIFSDNSSIEIFINDGEEVFTSRVYNDMLDTNVILEGEGTAIIRKWNI
ncbi:glycoside hydrolase family 32 protein [Clostridium sp.]